MSLFAFDYMDMPTWLMILLFLIAVGLGVGLFIMKKKQRDD